MNVLQYLLKIGYLDCKSSKSDISKLHPKELWNGEKNDEPSIVGTFWGEQIFIIYKIAYTYDISRNGILKSRQGVKYLMKGSGDYGVCESLRKDITKQFYDWVVEFNNTRGVQKYIYNVDIKDISIETTAQLKLLAIIKEHCINERWWNLSNLKKLLFACSFKSQEIKNAFLETNNMQFINTLSKIRLPIWKIRYSYTTEKGNLKEKYKYAVCTDDSQNYLKEGARLEEEVTMLESAKAIIRKASNVKILEVVLDGYIYI